MNEKKNDAAGLVNNECEPSTDKVSSKPSEDGKEPYIIFVNTKSEHISDVTGTSENRKIFSENEQPVPVVRSTIQTKKGESINFFFVELLLFLVMLSVFGLMACNKALYLAKACKVYLRYSSDICENATFYKTENDEAQKIANNFTIFSHLITMIPASILTIFIGSWSDKYGSKKPILVALFGLICQDVLLLLNSQYMDWPMGYLLLTAVPTGLTGSVIALNTCVYSFSSEKTATKTRTFRYAILELATVAAMPAGIFISGRLYQGWGYMPVYALMVTAHAVAFVYTALTMKETKTTDGHSYKTLASEFFSLDGLKENIRTCMKVRENNGRAQIGLLIGSMFIIILGYIAVAEIAYYFCKKMYGWKMPKYSDISTISTVVVIAVMVVTVPLLTRIWRVPDALLGILGCLSSMGQSFARSFAYEEWIYYTAIGVGCFSGFGPLAVRSRLSKIVSPDEVGKVFAVVSSVESLVPIFGSLVFLEIYNASISSFPGLAYLCCALFMVIPLISFVVIRRWETQHVPKLQSMESGIDAAASASVQ